MQFILGISSFEYDQLDNASPTNQKPRREIHVGAFMLGKKRGGWRRDGPSGWSANEEHGDLHHLLHHPASILE